MRRIAQESTAIVGFVDDYCQDGNGAMHVRYIPLLLF
jgi:hypothetical protein